MNSECEIPVRSVREVCEGGVIHTCEDGGIREGSALSPVLFAVLMGGLTDGVRQESLWAVIGDNICSESRGEVEV